MSNNRKLVRNIIIAVIVLIILGGAYYFVEKWEPEKEKTEEQPVTETKTEYIVDEKEEDVLSVRIKNGEKEYEIVKNTDGEGNITCEISGFSPSDINSSKIKGTFSELIKVPASKVIEKNASQKADFGLEVPQASFTINKKDGESKTVLVGDMTPTADEYYVMHENTDKIYTVSKYSVSSLFYNLNEYRKKTIISIPEAAGIKEFNLYKNDEPFIKIRTATEEEQKSDAMGGVWTITYPWTQLLDSEKTGKLFENFLSLDADSFADENGDFGFDYRLEMKTENEEFSVSIGKTDEKGTYVRNEKNGNIYIVKNNIRSVIEAINPNDYITKLAAIANIADIDNVVIKYKDITYTMKPGEEDNKKPYYINDKEVGEDEFKDKYIKVIGVAYKERTDEKITTEPELSVIYNYKDGKKEQIDYCRFDERDYIAKTPDGKTVKIVKNEIDKVINLISEK